MATGGAGGILRDTLADKVDALHLAISNLAALPKTNDSEQHLFENFHSSRTIRKLVLDCPSFAATLWKSALEGKCEMWAQGHRLAILLALFALSMHTIVVYHFLAVTCTLIWSLLLLQLQGGVSFHGII